MVFTKKATKALLLPYLGTIVVLFLLSIVQETTIIGRFSWPVIFVDFAMDLAFYTAAFIFFGYLLNRLYASESKLLNSNNTLSETNYELESFIYRATHDFRTPLTNIKGLLLAYEFDRSPESAKMYLGMLKDATEMLDNRLLELMEIATNKHKVVTQEKVLLRPFIKELVNDFSFTVSLDKIDMSIEIANDITIFSDRTRLKILLRNLLANAVKYRDTTKGKQSVRISVLRDGNAVNISIWDNGVGIPAEILPKVFEMFYRGSSLSSGSGLGLYIAKTISLSLKYDLQITSTEGQWTNVCLSLPSGWP
jgi:signal transduction histidine kinase